jgi:hypothetical protein
MPDTSNTGASVAGAGVAVADVAKVSDCRVMGRFAA